MDEVKNKKPSQDNPLKSTAARMHVPVCAGEKSSKFVEKIGKRKKKGERARKEK